MIDIKILREHPESVKKAVKNRQMAIDIDEIIKIDINRRKLQKEVDDKRSLKKQAGEKIAKASLAEKKKLITEMQEFDREQDRLEKKLAEIEEEFRLILLRLPNIPSGDTPVGADESGNVVIRKVGKPKKFSFEPKDANTLGEALGLIDTARAAKVAGSRFGYMFGELVRIEFALMRFALDKLLPHGFIPVDPPVMIKPVVYEEMGRLTPDQKDERYFIPADNLYLVGSAEHTLGPIHKDEILELKDLPRRYTAFTPCFRRESGTYGKDTKGILRVHQFNKMEMFSFALPEESDQEHQFLLAREEELYSELGLPYQVVAICTGDMGFTDAKQFDIETWMPGQGKYRETNSCSNTTDFQARGINARYRPLGGKTEFVHMLNATVFTGRTLIAILENNQQKDGSVAVPEVLVPYCGFEKITKA